MGFSAKLFYNPEGREKSLAYRIRPSDKQIEDQKERWNDLRSILVDDLKRKFDKPVSSWLQGSYKFGTQIRPARIGEEFDIDLGVYIEWAGGPKSAGIAPIEIKSCIQNILESYADDTENDATYTSEPKTRCNRICFSDDFHIDVPSYHLDRNTDSRDLATQEDKWEDSDPKAIYVWWKQQFDGADRDRARRLVRYLKMWAALKFEPSSRPSSILLTVMVASALKSINADEISGDDEYLRQVVYEIESSLLNTSKIENPVDRSEDLNRLSDGDFRAFVGKLSVLASICDRALVEEDELSSADVWCEAFGHFFPMPEDENQESGFSEYRSKGALAIVRYDPDVRVIATSGSGRWEKINWLMPIPRGCDIKFEVINSETFPEGAEVHWTVRNEGDEAELVNDLGHTSRTGLINEESSAYKGCHNVDVVVKLNGRVIGRRRVDVQVTGLGIPKRNPARRSWMGHHRR
jgi:hypothetical protein